ISSTVKPCAQNLASPTIKRTSINLTIKYGGLQFLLEFYLLNGLHAFSVELDQVIMKSIEINFFYKSIKQILGFLSWSIGNDAIRESAQKTAIKYFPEFFAVDHWCISKK